jgi:glycosyltransferase involved in cell wall biosynthesis
LEAWSVGTPVIVSELPTLCELVGGAGGGITVPRDCEALARAMVVLLNDPARLASLGRAGHDRWLSTYSTSTVVEQHDALYRTLIQDRAA